MSSLPSEIKAIVEYCGRFILSIAPDALNGYTFNHESLKSEPSATFYRQFRHLFNDVSIIGKHHAFTHPKMGIGIEVFIQSDLLDFWLIPNSTLKPTMVNRITVNPSLGNSFIFTHRLIDYSYFEVFKSETLSQSL